MAKNSRVTFRLDMNPGTIVSNEDGETMTLAQMVAEEIAANLSHSWQSMYQDEIRRQVTEHLACKPDSKDSLHAMIVAEAKAQLRPNPEGYRGTATPLSQYIGAEVYKVIRHEAEGYLDIIRGVVSGAVQAAVKKEQ